MSHGPFVIADQAIGQGAPIRAVSYLEPEQSWESGFCLFAGEPDDEIDIELACVDCLLNDQPNVGRSMDLARRHGLAIRDGDGLSTTRCA